MLITKEVELCINGNTIEYYKSKNYIISKRNIISVNDLLPNSKISVEVECDFCGHKHSVKYYNYFININKNNNQYFCTYCKKERTEKNNLKKYGVKSTLSIKDVQEKIKKTNIERYGVEYPIQNKQIFDKLKKTNIERYGNETSLLNNIVNEKRNETMNNKYGSIHALKNYNCIKKSKETFLRKYGVDSFTKTEEYKNIINQQVIDRHKENNIDIISISGNYYKIICNKKHEYIIHKDLLKTRLLRNIEPCIICNPINNTISDKENKLIWFIKENFKGEIITNDRSIIPPYELDIYLPELKLAFEFNGVYWHSEVYKEKTYHKMKSDMCDEKGIQLIHIWEDDWLYKEDIVKSMIISKIGTNDRIFARKCEIKEIQEYKKIKMFLEKNHIQGFVNASKKIGLFYNNELVSLMTFGKLRKPLNSNSIGNEYEMLRFCNKLNTNVVGGASKLFSYFLKNNDIENIISYANRDYSNGKLYKQLGFINNYKTEPNYYYIINGIKQYRFKYRKDILVKEGYDKTKTEHQIMLDRGIYRIYNSGNYKFIYK